ncbi:MAG TPA: hypothetical protein VMY78_16540 [Solirubrobacteraceae bacterium]|nr:hypothetical protein [Solirubrobacteraceae bacterium]
MAEFYALLLGLRLWAGDARDVPFACGWVAHKLGLPQITVWRALQTLKAARVLEQVGELPRPGKRAAHLYAPGALPSSAVGIERRAEVVGDGREPQAHLADEPLVLKAKCAVRVGRSLTAGGGASLASSGHGPDRTPLGGVNDGAEVGRDV